MNRNILVPVLGAIAIAVASTACAQTYRAGARPGSSHPAEVRRVAYDRGFREGLREGEIDGRARHAFRYQDERDFRRADIGYNRSYGDINRYRDAFRSGFAEGYTEGYQRFSRGYGANGRYGAPDDRGYGGYRNDGYLTPFDIGARDGFEKGREDARDRDRYDPRAQKWYREGDRDYNSRYGSRDRYKDEYRRGFLQGYERGYRGYR